jgi:hypothetical protein
MKFFKVDLGWSRLEIGDVIQYENESLKVISIISVDNDDGDLIVCGTGVPVEKL